MDVGLSIQHPISCIRVDMKTLGMVLQQHFMIGTSTVYSNVFLKLSSLIDLLQQANGTWN